jgi:hypothetical protein
MHRLCTQTKRKSRETAVMDCGKISAEAEGEVIF